MNDALNPIRHAYGEADSPPPAPDSPQRAELDLLQSMRTVLEQQPRHAPEAATLEAVKAAAKAYTLASVQAVYGEAEALSADDPRQAEVALLATTKAALDALPRVRPDADALAAITAAAKAATLAPLRHAYGETEDAPVAADHPQHAEYTLLTTTKAALDGLPRVRPEASLVSSIVGEAARQSARPSRQADDRPAQSRGTRRRLMGWVSTTAMLVVVAFSGLWVLNQPSAPEMAEALAEAAAPASQSEPSVTFEADEAPLVATVPEGNAPTLAPDRRPESQEAGSAGGGRADAGTRFAPPPAAEPSLGVAQESPAESLQGTGLTFADAVNADASELTRTADWEAGEDVRLLSLRLQQLAASSEGLAWDEPPVPLGSANGTESVRAMPNALQPVRSTRAPANVEVRMRTGDQQE